MNPVALLILVAAAVSYLAAKSKSDGAYPHIFQSVTRPDGGTERQLAPEEIARLAPGDLPTPMGAGAGQNQNCPKGQVLMAVTNPGGAVHYECRARAFANAEKN